MALHITSLTFSGFRSYETLQLRGLGPLTILVGPNAIGKTNIIEGIQLLTAQTTFRHATIEQLIHHGDQFARLEAQLQDDQRVLDIDVVLSGHAKRYRLNDKAKRPADLKGLLPSVVFTPDDLDLVKGSMGVRRHAIDALGSQLTSNYYLVRKDYEKVIRHKNHILKDQPDPALIDSINELLITCGSQLFCYREALFNRMTAYLTSRYESLSGGKETLTAFYVPSWEVMGKGRSWDESFIDDSWDGSAARESLQDSTDEYGVHRHSREDVKRLLGEALDQYRSEELARHRSLIGPHADQLGFSIDGLNASEYASQGQQRSIVLAFKLAELSVVEEVLDTKPVLLLDDVMSELDESRRSALVSYISQDVQTFITTANLSYFDRDMLEQADVISLPVTSWSGHHDA